MTFKFPVLVLVVVVLASCGKKDASVSAPGKPTASSPVSSATVQISSAVNTLSNLSPTSAAFTSFQELTAGGTWWDDSNTANLCDERVDKCDVRISGKDYVTIQLTPDAARANGSYINVFGRLKSGLGVICAVGEAMDSSKFTGSYLNDGTHKVEMTDAMEERIGTICGMNGGDEEGEEDTGPNILTVTVTTNSDKTLYEKTLAVCFGEVETCTVESGKAEEVFMYKIEDGKTNIASFSPSHDTGNEHYYSRLLVKMDTTAETIAVEYLSATKNVIPAGKSKSIEVLRLLKKGNEGIILSSFNRADSGDQVYMIKGNINDKASDVSMSFAQYVQPGIDTTTVKGNFNRLAGTFDSAATVNTAVNFGSTSALQGVVYPGYDSDNYAKLSVLDAPNFTEFDQVRTTALLGTP